MINTRLIQLRKTIKSKRKNVIDILLNNHNASICIICSTTENLTKEHVLPKWTFENDQNRSFITGVNGINQSYSKTTLPACSYCNSYILGALENYLELLFRHTDLNNNYFSNEEKSKVILWLEIIDYKFNVLNLRRKFKKAKKTEYIPYLSEFPVSIIQNIDVSPHKIFSLFRQSLKKLEVKNRTKQLNSLVIFTTSNDGFYFFHNTNEFIFIELPQYKIALFYHINEIFECEKDAYNSAMKIIKIVYEK